MKHTGLRRIGDVVVLTPRGLLTGDEETDELDKAFRDLPESGNRRLVVNLLETVHLNSTALGVFAAAHDRYESLGGKIRLCHLSDRIRSVLVVTHLGSLFEDFATEREAVESFAAEPKPSS